MDQDLRGESKGPASANVLEVIRSMLPILRKSDRKVAETVLADPNRALNFTVAEAAMLAGVTQPTVIRFANAIGCTGYQDFRIRLAACRTEFLQLVFEPGLPALRRRSAPGSALWALRLSPLDRRWSWIFSAPGAPRLQ